MTFEIGTLLTNLRKNQMEAYYVPTKADVVPLVASLLTPGETVAVGGSQTLDQTGVLALLRGGEYDFLDRYDPALTAAQRQEVFRQQVILVVGVNKIVPDLAAAVYRVKTIVAPLNAKRLNCDTYCNKAGHCIAVDGSMTDGCHSPSRICCGYLVSGQQRQPGRIKVILVGEPCGY